MNTQNKLYGALALAVVMGIGLYTQKKNEARDTEAHSLEGRLANLPKIGVTDEQAKSIDKVELTVVKDDKTLEHQLVKTGDESWQLKQPVDAVANASYVKTLIESLPKLSVAEEISKTNDDYAKWGLSDDKALHAVFKKGDEVVFDAFFGEGGTRGQMTRLPGKDGVYAVKGYSKWYFDRDTKGWRDRTIFKFEDKDAVKVAIVNHNGNFSFEKQGDDWLNKGKAIANFKSSKVNDLLRSYKALSAVDFADGKSLAEVGLETPEATITIELTGGSGNHVLTIGNIAEGTNRWVKANSKEQIFSISSWAADWGTTDGSKFIEAPKAEGDKAEGDSDSDDDMPAMPMPNPHG